MQFSLESGDEDVLDYGALASVDAVSKQLRLHNRNPIRVRPAQPSPQPVMAGPALSTASQGRPSPLHSQSWPLFSLQISISRFAVSEALPYTTVQLFAVVPTVEGGVAPVLEAHRIAAGHRHSPVSAQVGVAWVWLLTTVSPAACP